MNEPQNPPPFSLQMPVRKEQRGKFNSTRHSLPDLFEGLNQPPAFLAQHNPHIQVPFVKVKASKIKNKKVWNFPYFSGLGGFEKVIFHKK